MKRFIAAADRLYGWLYKHLGYIGAYFVFWWITAAFISTFFVLPPYLILKYFGVI